ncbi:MAG TPA: phosphate signaling complex protein PhoU [Gallionella sp.]|nr:phosphate signaling complex protein PhoU [Gallionella sp.]
MTNSEHTLKQYDVELESVRARVLQMGELVKRQVLLAIASLIEGNPALADRIIADDQLVNTLEVAIDESCTRIIARRQPTAVDLRMVIMVIKTITDLERIGDEAKRIAATARILAQKKNLSLPRFDKIKHVSNMTLDMLDKSLDAFSNMDISTVAEVVRQDEQVDEEFRIILRNIVSFMMEDPRTISSALEILLVAKSIERIGDHAKNMSEYVVYMVKGRDVRHITADEIEREVGDNSQ